MNSDVLETLRQIERDKNISFEELVVALEGALSKAYRGNYHEEACVKLRIDDRGRSVRVVLEKRVVEKVEEPGLEISVQAAQRYNPMAEVGQTIDVPMAEGFSRIAAATTRQVLLQNIRDIEQRRVAESFQEKSQQVVTATIHRKEPRGYFVYIGRMEAFMPARETIPGEQYRFNERFKVYVAELRELRNGRHKQMIVSRTHPFLLSKLLEMEVPEIAEGIVQIKNVVREPGARSKVAVFSADEKVDPLGACIGPRGTRIQAVVNELRNERVDIVPWKEDPAEFIAEALSPARPVSVKLSTAAVEGSKAPGEERRAYVVVPDSKLSLAIGNKGQNVRLAARLTGYHIDIRSETQDREAQDQERELQDRIRAEFEAARLATETPVSDDNAAGAAPDAAEDEGISINHHDAKGAGDLTADPVESITIPVEGDGETAEREENLDVAHSRPVEDGKE